MRLRMVRLSPHPAACGRNRDVFEIRKEPPMTDKPLSKRERNRKIKQIYRDFEAQKRTLGLRAPVLKKGPMFYMVVLIGMALLGGALIQMSGKADAIGLGGRKLRDGRPVMAQERAARVAMTVTRDA